jgi:hypothetical protein
MILALRCSLLLLAIPCFITCPNIFRRCFRPFPLFNVLSKRLLAQCSLYFAIRCVVYGYPSTGGVLIKDGPDLLDMLFLSVPHIHPLQRSPSADEEDRFCNLMRRIGANFWPSKKEWIKVMMQLREITEEEEKVMVYGWPTDGVGVWVLRYGSASQMPLDFGRMSFAMNMDERIQIMKEYGAMFFEDVTQVKEFDGTSD